MKTITKCLIAGGIIIAGGAAMLIAGLCMGGVTSGEKYSSATYTATEEVTSVQIEAECAVVTINYYDGEYAQIIYPESYKRTNTIAVRSGVLEITSEIKTIFSALSINNEGPILTINLPYTTTVNLELELDYGEMNVTDGDYSQVEISLNAGTVNVGNISCTALDVEVNTGEVIIENADCPATDIEVNVGSVTATYAGGKEEYTIRREVALGSCNVASQTGSTSKYINVEINVGSVTILFEG